ncbi:Long chronological lifespan protein 2 [Tilletia horrida]|nr:Long chronological lifespan protein 2 [Tilletia horrida]
MRCPSILRSGALSSQTLFLLCLALVASLIPSLVSAQGFFSNFFSGHHQGEQEAPPLGDAKWFHDRVEAATCTEYLCPRTLSCVSGPEKCPCPFPQQIACPYSDFEPEGDDHASGSAKKKAGGSVCITAKDCSSVQRLLQLGSGFKLKDLKA